jgi:predicted dehydrogenase
VAPPPPPPLTAVNVGVVGCGRVARDRHLPALRTVAGARVVAVADPDPARLDDAASAHRVPRRYRSHRDLVADGDVEAVAVCVPAGLHADVAVTALQAGKHVLIEKPLCLTLAEAARIRAAAAHASATVMVGFNLRRHRLVLRARDLVAAGAIGEIEAIRTALTSTAHAQAAGASRFGRHDGGGTLFEMAPHHLDLWRFLTGREAVEVHTPGRSGDDRTAIVTGVLEGGVLASTLVSRRATNVNEVEVVGTGGTLRVDCYRYDGLALQARGGFEGDARHRARALLRTASAVPGLIRRLRATGDYVGSFAAEWRHFLACAADGRPAEPGLEDGVRNLELLLAALESSASGRSVRLEPAAAAVGT